MAIGYQRLWQTIGGCSLAGLGAAAVICIRLATAMPESASLPPAIGTRAESVRQIPSVAKMDIESLLAPDHGGQLERCMEDRPGEMMAYIDSLEDRELAMELAGKFIKAVGVPHYDLLRDWLARQKDGRLAVVIFRGIIPRLVRENPDECVGISLALGDGQEAWEAREVFFVALPFEQGLSLMKRQTPEERAWLLSRKAGGFGGQAPEMCLEMFEALPPSAHRGEAAGKLIHSWANGTDVFHLADPVSAVKGVMAIADPGLRRECLKTAVLEWSEKNAEIASRWITKLPAGPDRDVAIGGLVTRLAPSDPGAAVEWAAAISDETLRQETIGRLEESSSGKAHEEP